MKKLIITAFLSVVCTVAALAAQYKEIHDIPYSANTDAYSTERCKLDVYYPTDMTDVPVVVWFHGGGLTGGGKFIPAEFKDKGIAVVAVNYRLLPKAELAEVIDDAAAAVAWTMKNAAQYNGNPHKIVVSGHSAGGYLTSMVGLDKKYLAKYGMDPDSLAALMPMSGQVITHFAQRKNKGMGELQPLIDETAPLYHVRPDCPPYVIVTGDREDELFGRYEENAYMWRMMKLVGHPDVSIYELDGHNHGDMVGPGLTIALKNMDRLLKNR